MTVETETNLLREKISTFLGFKGQHKAPATCSQRQWDENEYTRFLIEYDSPDGDTIEAFLLLPHGSGPFPGVLVLHQHASQWTVGKGEVCGVTGDRFQAFGPALARRGVCVLAPDAIGFESRLASTGAGKELAPTLDPQRADTKHWLQYYNALSYRLLRGDTLMRKVLDDTTTALGVLAYHPSVDRNRLGIVGHSFGGAVALFMGALQPDLKYICSSGAACTYRRRIEDGTGIEFSQVIPGFATKFDVDDLVKCMAPRRVLLVSSTDDPYSRDADEIVAAACPVFDAHRCPEHLSHFRANGAHALDDARYNTIIHWLTTEAFRSEGSS